MNSRICGKWVIGLFVIFSLNSLIMLLIDRKLPHPNLQTDLKNCKCELCSKESILVHQNKNDDRLIDFSNSNVSSNNIEPEKIKTNLNNKWTPVLKKFNELSEIKNRDKFQLEPNFIPIVIRGFSRAKELETVVEYLKKVESIEKTMLIFSIDGFTADLFDVINTIDFCQVKQMIHPYSSSLLEGSFPGFDPNIASKDQFNHERDYKTASVAGIKHHIWWLWNTIFDEMKELREIPAALFIEDDHIVTSDLYVSMKMFLEKRKTLGTQTFGMTFGSHQPFIRGKKEELGLAVLDNLGVLLTREDWKAIKSVKEAFCKHDDYNWDLTITKMQDSGVLPYSLRVLWSRVAHIGTCGVHTKEKKNCDFQPAVSDFENILHKPLLNEPPDWNKFNFVNRRVDSTNMNGFKGWGGYGLKDQEHCLSIVNQEDVSSPPK